MSPKMKAYKLKKMVLTWYHYSFNNNERKRKHLPKKTKQLMKQRAKENLSRLMKEREEIIK